jgi:GT2 family glycosyltransferase
MYYEETDLAYRAWKAGYRIVHYGPATAVHLGGRSSFPSGDEEVRLAAWKKIRAIFYQSWRYFLLKHGFLGEANVIRGLLTVFFTVHYLAAFMLGKQTMVLHYRYELETLHQGWKPTVLCR